MAQQLQQSTVNYDPTGGEAAASCASCKYYDGKGACSLVEGTILPGGVCDLWTEASPADLSAGADLEAMMFAGGSGG